MSSQSSFKELSFCYPNHSIDIANIKIPIKVHISQISDYKDESLQIGLIEEVDNMGFEFEKNKEFEIIRSNFKFINIKDRLYEDFTKNFLEYYEIDSTDELLEFLDESDIMIYTNHIFKIISAMKIIYIKRLHNSLGLDKEKPKIDYTSEHKMPSNIQDYLKYTETYMLSQSFIEFNSTPFFSENIGIAVEEFSWREIKLRLAYMTMKFSTEDTVNTWQAKVSQGGIKDGR